MPTRKISNEESTTTPTRKRSNEEATTMLQNLKKAKTNSSSDAQVVGNWNDLPPELKLEVLARARLPIKEWATLRAVSREFSSLLSDPSFATLYEAYPPPKQTMFFVNSLRFSLSFARLYAERHARLFHPHHAERPARLFHPHHAERHARLFHPFDAERHARLFHPFDAERHARLFHPYHAERHAMSRSRARAARESIFSFHDETDKTINWTCPLQGPPVLSLVASNDGFLCFLGHRESKPAIFVCNPMIPGVWAILTIEYGGPKCYPDCLIGIGFDRKLGAGKIVLCGRLENSEEEITRTLVYNGKKDTWRKVSDIDDILVPAYMNDPFVFEGHFCWVVRSKRQGRQMVMFFNVENEAWEQPILLDQQWSGPACLIELEKQLCLLRSDETGILEVWKLGMDTRSVTFVQNVELPFHGYDVFGGEDVLYASFQYELRVCKIVDGNWHRAVRCRTDRFDRGDWICRVRPFNPSLFRFHAGAQPRDCCSPCRIDPSENNADPMSVDT